MRSGWNFADPIVTSRVETDKDSPNVFDIKCADCHHQFSIYFDDRCLDDEDDYLEIGGVMATRKQWREILKQAGL